MVRRMCGAASWLLYYARYELLYTPHVANLKLWKTSGHFDFYKEGMFDQMDVEGDEYQIKPMNCPFHCLVYKDDLRSYRYCTHTPGSSREFGSPEER